MAAKSGHLVEDNRGYLMSHFRKKIIPHCTVLLSSLIFSTTVSAHDFWVLPHDARNMAGDDVLYELRIGPGWPGKRTARLPGLISTFDAWDAEGKREVVGHDGALVIGHIKSRVAGAMVTALTTNGARLTLPAQEFEDYLQEEGLSKIIQARRKAGDSGQPGTELFTRYAKTLTLVDGSSKGFDRVLGLERELVALNDPLHYQPGKPFAIRLLASGKALEGVQVKAELNTTPPTVLKETTDARGEVTFVLPKEGEWLFSAVDMVPEEVSDADWHSLWASLTVPVNGENSA